MTFLDEQYMLLTFTANGAVQPLIPHSSSVVPTGGESQASTIHLIHGIAVFLVEPSKAFPQSPVCVQPCNPSASESLNRYFDCLLSSKPQAVYFISLTVSDGLSGASSKLGGWGEKSRLKCERVKAG